MKLTVKPAVLKFTGWISSLRTSAEQQTTRVDDQEQPAGTLDSSDRQDEDSSKDLDTTTTNKSRPIASSRGFSDAPPVRKAKDLASRTSTHLRDFSLSNYHRGSYAEQSRPQVVISAPSDFRRTSGLSPLSVLQQQGGSADDSPNNSCPDDDRLQLSIHQPENRLLDLSTVLRDFDSFQQDSKVLSPLLPEQSCVPASPSDGSGGFDHYRFPRKPVGSAPKRSSMCLSPEIINSRSDNPLIPHFSTRARPLSTLTPTEGTSSESLAEQTGPPVSEPTVSPPVASTTRATNDLTRGNPKYASHHANVTRWLITAEKGVRKASLSSTASSLSFPEKAATMDSTSHRRPSAHYRIRTLSGSTLSPSFTNVEFGDVRNGSGDSRDGCTAASGKAAPWRLGVHFLA